MTLTADLRASADCISLERLGEALTDPEIAHMRSCPRCEAEYSLLQSFNDSTPAADEGAAVQWIVAELGRRSPSERPASAQRPRGWMNAFHWRPVASLAALLLIVSAGYLMWDPAPRIVDSTPGTQIYRTTTLTVTAPRGDITTAPSDLSWVGLERPVRYDVQVLEIDRTPLWSASTRAPRIELPASIRDRIVPGKTLLWTVTAVDDSGTSVAESGLQSFRVTVAPNPGRN